jgi:hypothetical protein
VFTGRKLEQWPPDFGTSCLADARWDPAIADAGVAVLQALGYSGISEIEFVEDAATGRACCSTSTPARGSGSACRSPPASTCRCWPTATRSASRSTAGRSATACGGRSCATTCRCCGRAATVPEEQVTKAEWTALLAGRPSDLVDAVHDPDDPEPAYDVLWSALSGRQGYRCAC